MTDADQNTSSRAILNAQAYRYTKHLDDAADLLEHDPDRWAQLPERLQDLASIHADLRGYYRDAVKRGLIPDDRGPDAA